MRAGTAEDVERGLAVERLTLALQPVEYLAWVAALQQRPGVLASDPLDQRVDVAVEPHRDCLAKDQRARLVVAKRAAAGRDHRRLFADQPGDHPAFAVAEVGLAETLEDFAHAHPRRAFDLIIRVDTQSTLGWSINQVSDSLTGTPGTKVKVSFRRPGVPATALSKLRRGGWSLQAQIDLHGLRRDEAREALGRFLSSCSVRGLRCVRVVHGKGHGSPGREGILRVKVRRWLVQREEVLAFVQARPAEGGAGALVVLLQGI